MENGKLIVIDGADGAGKATQTTLLVARLKEEGVLVETLDFPQYTENTFGKLLRQCLNGEHGDFMHIDPRIASTLYAADRFESKEKIKGWLNEGKTVVLDRYVSANMLHQGAKIHDHKELEDFLNWLDHIEHEIFGSPRPDLIVYLDVPAEDRRRMVEEAVAAEKHKGQGIDAAEADFAHQKAAEERAKDIVKLRNNWKPIVCTQNGTLRTREAVHEEVWNLVTEARG